MSKPSQPRFFTADVSVSAEGDGGKFAGVAYSGGRIPQWNAVIDLSTTKVSEGMPLLLDHGRGIGGSSPIGVHREANNDGRQFTVAGDLFGDIDERADAIRVKSKRGIKYQMSVGLYDSNDEYVTAGKTIQLNGQTFTGPLLVLRNGVIREASIVTLGADPNTTADVFSAAQPPRSNTMTLEELQARVIALEAENKDLKTRADTAEEALATQKREARLASVKALFADTKREFSEDKAKPYLAMSDEAFEAIATDLRAAGATSNGQNRTQTDPHLFREHAQGAPAGGGGKSPLLADAEARGWTKK
jgi:hypothetical protein